MPVVITSAAKADIDEARDWYDVRQQGLGSAFVDEVAQAIRRIVRHPDLAQPLDGGYLRLRLGRFRYAIIYRVIGDEIRILAVGHQHRKPGFWRNR